MKEELTVKRSSILTPKLSKMVKCDKVTSDFVLSLYEKSKAQKGKKKEDILQIANILSKHIGKQLVD